MEPSSIITVATSFDRVFFTIGTVDVPMPYATALTIAQHIRVAANQAIRMVREDLGIKASLIRDSPILDHPGRQFRLRKFTWRIKVKDWDEQVYLFIDDLEIMMHFETALNFSNDLTRAARIAKKRAGDSARSINAVGLLSDAEVSYKNGWAR